ncbi:hypothetical protein [Niveispirillum cyanobacteriorum]|uniref:Uncharacterized protein n=1 Tax=Niveispirillum cyanobacteriorum TaxID=1612173 RepID=A0A2K9NFR2_9PROT|nr:hypothetical protein [Niveispirillum cyanobacteriorum]AUN31963.1 hypothetical protein C0V82_16165 [Niveispirillum cyanobacteriorum]GGE85398.1 hypothetical protein GCM10011317_48220 [Niveispirillum cyanobacteriorum]
MSGVKAEVGTVLLVFCNETQIAWLRILKRGFRHVFIAQRVVGGWVTIDPLSTRMEVEFHPMDPETNLASWFTLCGHRVVSAQVRGASEVPIGLPLAPLTCVSVAKRVLGIRVARILTPWQLYRHLTERGCPEYRPVQGGRDHVPA